MGLTQVSDMLSHSYLWGHDKELTILVHMVFSFFSLRFCMYELTQRQMGHITSFYFQATESTTHTGGIRTKKYFAQ